MTDRAGRPALDPENLAGATGMLTFSGVENLSTRAFTETIAGTLRSSGDDD
jgi:hypothetical protein